MLQQMQSSLRRKDEVRSQRRWRIALPGSMPAHGITGSHVSDIPLNASNQLKTARNLTASMCCIERRQRNRPASSTIGDG